MRPDSPHLPWTAAKRLSSPPSPRERHGVDWDIVVADSRLEDVASEGLAGLSAIEGVPVTVFVNRDGTVHAVYTGFSGPAAGEAHERAIAQFRQLTREILDGA